MKILNHIIEGNLRSLQPIAHFKIHRWPGGVKHLVWWKLSVTYGPNGCCEHCDVETGLEAVCQDCYDHHYCECGRELDSPGNGFCPRCR